MGGRNTIFPVQNESMANDYQYYYFIYLPSALKMLRVLRASIKTTFTRIQFSFSIHIILQVADFVSELELIGVNTPELSNGVVSPVCSRDELDNAIHVVCC